MKTWNILVKACAFFVVLIPTVVFASGLSNPGDGAAACGCCGTFIFIPIAFLVLSIALLVWVARDAKAGAWTARCCGCW